MKSIHLFGQSFRVIVAAILITGQMLPADTRSPRASATDLLIQKARSLEARERADLAAQVWQQVLITNPNQPDALAGLARWAKRSGKNDEANAYLAKLRRVSPDAPVLTQLDSPDTAHGASGRLEEAGKLAASGKPDEAMRIYREVFGSAPPAGGWAVAYYETLANTPGGLGPALAALRKLAAAYPDVPIYQLAAGKLMTYQPATRQAGIALLSSVSGSTGANSEARQALRQALIWEKSNPAYAPAIEAYVSRYADPELKAAATALRTQSVKPERPTAEKEEEQLGYLALKNGNMADAERQFSAALTKDDRSGRAHAGLGFIHMKAGDFDAAVQEFEAARKASPNDATIKNSLDSAKFWQAMQLAAKSADTGDWTEAVKHYQSAIALRPNADEALRALGGALLAAGFPGKAVPYLSKVVRSKTDDQSSWCALVSAKLQAEGAKAALTLIHSVPESAADLLNRNVRWQALEASAYVDTGNDSRAGEIYRRVMGSDALNLSTAEQIDVAGLALKLHQPAQALPFAQSAVEAKPKDPGAWEVLLPALVGSGRPKEAERAFARMPEETQKLAMSHPGFLQTLASLKESNSDLDSARELLEQTISSPDPTITEATRVAIKLHLAQLLAKLGRGTEAETMVTAILDAHPDNVDAWKAHFLVLQALGRENDIVRVASGMGQSVAARLGADGEVVTLLARAQASAGDSAFAIKLLDTYIARTRTSDPAAVMPQRIQLGWLLLDAPGESSRLYSLLTSLSARTDLTRDQRKEVTDLWSTWILRSAESARRSGNVARALGLLEQGLNMLPGNSEVQRAFAGNLLAAGNTRRALNVYANWDLAGAQADDYAGAIGAALAERNTQYAEAWIDRGLAQWPNNPKLLELAGERAKARGDLKKAELYWKQALAEKKSQSKDTLAAGTEASPTSLRALLIGSEGRPAISGSVMNSNSEGRDSLVSPLDQDAPRVHLSSFSSTTAPREDFVRSTVPAGTSISPSTAARSSFLINSALPASASVDTLEDKIASLEGRNSPYIGSRMSVWGRNGEAGFGRMLIEQAEFEASTTLSNSLRASFLLKPTYLSGGTASGSGESLFGRQTSVASFGPQSASGLAAEAQVSSQSFGLRIGITPQGFVTHNWVGGLRVQPKDGPIAIILERDSVKDTMLSYAGARDPQSGQTWGGVMANTASVQGRWGDDRSGMYASGGYQSLQGRSVARNTGVSGGFGTWWKLAVSPAGDLTLGTNFSAMHYDRNLRYFTFGQGGYFSPQQYFLFNVPVRWTGTYGHRLQYAVGGSLGLQHFVEDGSDYYPTDAALQAKTRERYQALTSTGANFSFDARLNYQMAPHWILGAFASANNARNYTASSAGLFVKYTFEERPMNFENALPSVPDWRGQQPFLIY